MMKKMALLVLILAVLIMGGCGKKEEGQQLVENKNTSGMQLSAGTGADKQAVNLQLLAPREKNTISLEDLYTDKPVYLNFWATWCGPCVGELPNIEAVYKKYQGQVNFVLIPVDEDFDDVEVFLKKQGLVLPVYKAETNINEINYRYNLQAIPISLLIDKHGTIIARHVGSMSKENLEKFLAPVLRKKS